jgi:hypothetical protein
MAKPIVLEREGAVSRFDFSKVTRAQVYGRKRRVPLGPDGEPCARASLAFDGSLLLRSGMSGQGYFEEDGHWIPAKELVGMDPEGKALPFVPSTLGEAQALEGPHSPRELLDLQVESVYALEPVEVEDSLASDLQAGKIYSFAFNYRGDYQAEKGFLVGNDEGFFALVGQTAEPEWCELDEIAPPAFDDEAEEDDDIDFEML